MSSPTELSPRKGRYIAIFQPESDIFDFNSSPFSTRSSQSDAVLISGDGCTLYVDRFLLTYVSPVFKDMYDVPSPSDNSDVDMVGEEARAVRLVEPVETLDALFRHADPKHTPPRLSINQLFSVMRAAQKYQMDGPLSRLRSSLTAPSIIRSPSPSPAHSPLQSPKSSARPINLIVSNPLPVAVLAHTFSFHEELRMALRELARVHIDLIVRNEQECVLPAEVFQYILQLRRQRSIWLKTKAKLIYQYPITPIPSTSSTSPSTSLSSSLFGSGGNATAVTKDCAQCTRHRAYHIHDACGKVDDQPSWGAFKAEIQRNHTNKCSCGALTIPTNNEKFNAEFNKWEEEARQMEAELPEWPPAYMSMSFQQKSF